MFIFSECMASSSFYPLGICAVDVGDNVVIRLVHSGISESLQQNDFVVVIRLFLFFCHHCSLLSVFIWVCKYLYITNRISFNKTNAFWSFHFYRKPCESCESSLVNNVCRVILNHVIIDYYIVYRIFPTTNHAIHNHKVIYWCHTISIQSAHTLCTCTFLYMWTLYTSINLITIFY